MMMNLTGVVLAKNEEKNIRKCLSSLSFCDEILVIDDYSSDKTVKIAKKQGAKIYIRKLNKDFASQRNFALDKAKGKWVLFVDADEVVGDQLKREIIQIVNNPFIKENGFYIKRVDYFLGKEIKYGEMGNMYLLRLARKGAGVWKRNVHEFWDVKGRKGKLISPLYHFSHNSLFEFIEDINFLSTLHSLANEKEGKEANLFKIVFFPFFHFIKNYILKGGYKDGTYGFVVAFLMSFHSFLSWSKQWLRVSKSFKEL